MEPSPAVSSRLIGAIFVERGLITAEQLEQALAEQQRTGQRLGEILVSSYDVPRLELASALAEQWADLERPPAGEPKHEQPATADTDAGDLRAVSGEWTDETYERRQIGEIFLERGLVTEEQLDGALQQQQDSGERLGEILVTQGVVTRVDLASALAEQWAELPKLRPPGAESETPRASVSPALAEDLRRSIADLTTRVDGVVDRVRIAGEAATNDAELVTLRETVEELKTWAEDERTGGRDTRERLEEAVRRLESVDGVAVRLDAIEQRLDRDATAAVLADTAAALRHDIDALADAVQLLGDQAGTDLSLLREEISGLAGSVSTRDDASGRLAAELAGRLAALESGSEQGTDTGADERAELRSLLDGLATRIDDSVSELHARLEAHAAEGFDADATQAEANGVLNDQIERLRASVESLTEAGPSVDGLRDGLATELNAALDARIGDLSTRLDAASAGDAELGARVDTLASTVESLQAATPALDAVREELTRQLESSLEGRLRDVRGELENDVRGQLESAAGSDADIRARLETLAASIDSVSGTVPTVDALRNDLSHELRALLDERVGELNARVEAGAAGDAALGDRIAALAESVESLAGSAPSVDAIRAELTQDVHTALDERISDVYARLDHGVAGDAELGERIERLAHSVAALTSTAPSVDAIRVEVTQELHASLDARLAELTARLESVSAGDEDLSRRVRKLAASLESLAGSAPSADAIRAELTQELHGTLDARLAELTARLESVSAGDEDLSRRVRKLAASLESLAGSTPSADAIRAELTQELQTTLDARLAELTARLESVSAGDQDLSRRVRKLSASVESLAGSAPSADAIRAELTQDVHTALDERIGELHARLNAGAAGDVALGERISALAASVESLAGSAPSVDAIRAELTHDVHTALDERISDVYARLDHGVAGDAELGERIERLAHSVAALTSTAPSVDAIRAEVTQELQASLDARLGELTARLESVSAGDEDLLRRVRKLAASVESLAASAPSVDAIRTELTQELQTALDVRVGELDARLAAGADDATQRDDKLRKRLDRLAESFAALESATPRAETLRDEIAASLQPGLDARLGELRAELESSQARAAHAHSSADDELRGRVDALAAAVEPLAGTAERVDGLRHELAGDLHRALESRLGELRAELEASRADHDVRQVARAEADSALRERVDGLAAAVESVAGTTGAIESLRYELETSQGHAVQALHGELRTVVDSVAVEAGRLIDTESRLAQGLDALVRRLDAVETRVSGVEVTVDETAGLDTVAREELERLAAGFGHRLDGLEHAVTTGGVEALRMSLEALEQRVESQTGIVEEQARVTERAVRKGLATLGERLAESEAAYVEAGSALRRSVERLGWAIEDADRAIASPVPSPDEIGHVVFAPTVEGYRLVACDGVGPGVGAVLELAEVNGPVVVARVGLSPLPFDRRPCLFVEPWRPAAAPHDA